jgi:hypothetical protein
VKVRVGIASHDRLLRTEDCGLNEAEVGDAMLTDLGLVDPADVVDR